MASRDEITFASIPILLAEKEKNFFDLAQILGPLPKAWAGYAACFVDRSGEEDSRNRPFLETFGSAFLESGSLSPQARPRLLQNLKTYLIIRISKCGTRPLVLSGAKAPCLVSGTVLNLSLRRW
ncbi:hypothetical protein Krac_9445 [Ktedonobacter racemifer DSM 44963]|uniref:Uncharacterized protein n=1 Tax=Ktedonobacter racemifer DSM 44963 TaxID=485913 RepID=D6TC28_KTERA|nr:hypothetical protein Krac_9445 [Ktedonobacter racemifer DSM 44963]